MLYSALLRVNPRGSSGKELQLLAHLGLLGHYCGVYNVKSDSRTNTGCNCSAKRCDPNFFSADERSERQ